MFKYTLNRNKCVYIYKNIIYCIDKYTLHRNKV